MADEEKKEATSTEQVKDAPARQWDADIKKLGDKIVGLTLMQAKELGDYLKEVHGIEPAAGAVAMVAAGGGEAAEVEKTTFDVIIKEVGGQKIKVIKEVRALTALGLKEAKDLVDNCPKPVKEGVSKEEAEEAQSKLEAVGATVEVA